MRYIPINGNELHEKGFTNAVVPSGPIRVTKDMVGDSSTPFVPSTIVVDSMSVTSTIMANLGFQGLTVSNQTNVTYFVLDLVAANNAATLNPLNPNNLVVNGVGLRVGFSAVNVAVNAAVSVGGLAASATLNGTTTHFQAQALGVGLNTASLPFVQSLINAAAALDINGLQSLGSAFSQFIDYLASATSLTPVTVGIVMNTGGTQEESMGASYCYALRCVHDGYCLNDALGQGADQLPKGAQRLDPVLWATYSSILASSDPTQQPTDTNMQLAKNLLTAN
jgi:hypothetical protein